MLACRCGTRSTRESAGVVVGGLPESGRAVHGAGKDASWRGRTFSAIAAELQRTER